VKKILYIAGFILLCHYNLVGQSTDPQFTQFYSVPLYLAPSFAGATQEQRFSGTYRNQFTAISNGVYSTYTAAYDYYFAKYNSGFGLMFMRDQAGAGSLGTTLFSLLYSYDLLLFNTWHVRPGLSFVYRKYSIDPSKLVLPNQTGPDGTTLSNVVLPLSKPYSIDGSVSCLVYTDRTWNGLTIDHLLRPNISFYGDNSLTPLKYTFYGGAKIISKGKLLKPVDESMSVAYQLRIQGLNKQIDLGLYWYNSPIVLGLWYRGIPLVNSPRGDAIAALIGFKRYNFSFAYSYDFTISYLQGSSGGSHEVSLIYEFYTVRKKKFHAIPCPEF